MKNFRNSFFKFISKYDEWVLRKINLVDTPFDILFSEKFKLYIHLIENDKRLENLHSDFFQTISLYCFEHNIKLIHLREEQWQEKSDFIKHRLNSIFESNLKIHARQCKIRRIDKVEYDAFLNQNHLLQTAKTKFKFGLFKKEELVGVMGISGGRWMTKENDLRRSYEMIRFATKTNTTVVGGFSKLMKHIEEELEVQEWMSYFDLDWVVSNVYTKMGFQIKEIQKPKKLQLNAYFTHTSGNLKLIKRING